MRMLVLGYSVGFKRTERNEEGALHYDLRITVAASASLLLTPASFSCRHDDLSLLLGFGWVWAAF